jgi:hypothetical protein
VRRAPRRIAGKARRSAQWPCGGGEKAIDGCLSAIGVIPAGDYNGDGKADILMQNDSGQVWQWLTNGNQIIASNSVGNPGSSWSVA